MHSSSKTERIREQVDRLGRPSMAMLDREIARCERRESRIRLVRGALTTLVAAAAVVVVVSNLWVSVFLVDGSSMNPQLMIDDMVLALNTGNPAKNDIIAFDHDGRIYIKRVIAVAGDWVNIDNNGTVSVNGRVLQESYVTELSLGDSDINYPCLVHSGTVFVMGDNRPSSGDSRIERFGLIPLEQIIGRVVIRIWPPSRIGGVS